MRIVYDDKRDWRKWLKAAKHLTKPRLAKLCSKAAYKLFLGMHQRDLAVTYYRLMRKLAALEDEKHQFRVIQREAYKMGYKLVPREEQ